MVCTVNSSLVFMKLCFPLLRKEHVYTLKGGVYYGGVAYLINKACCSTSACHVTVENSHSLSGSCQPISMSVTLTMRTGQCEEVDNEFYCLHKPVTVTLSSGCVCACEYIPGTAVTEPAPPGFTMSHR